LLLDALEGARARRHTIHSTMTSLVSWLSVDSRSPAALYIATDSRITWDGPEATDPRRNAASWDVGRKVFAARSSPEIFGLVGDAFLSTQVLTQLVDRIDTMSPAAQHLVVEERIKEITLLLKSSLSLYPRSQRRPSAIFYGCREGDGGASLFHLIRFAWSESGHVDVTLQNLPKRSDVVATDGSGKGTVDNHLFHWNKTEAGGTSRAIFSSFCDAVSSGNDWRTGGAPQLVAVTRIRAALQIGVIESGKLYLNGGIISAPKAYPRVEWRNRLFERCSPYTKLPLPKAQRHARPRTLL
jgi:hypothetical protein